MITNLSKKIENKYRIVIFYYQCHNKMVNYFTSLTRLYYVGAVGTGIAVALGNLYNSFRICNDKVTLLDMDYDDSEHSLLPEYIPFSLGKGVAYGLIWPYIVPKSLYDAYCLEPEYVHMNNNVYADLFCDNDRKINKNALTKHFIPQYHLHVSDPS